MPIKLIRAFLVFVMLGSFSLLARAQDWAQWHGANRDGVAEDFGAPVSLSGSTSLGSFWSLLSG